MGDGPVDRAGFAFPNAFVNVLATLPTGARVATAGRCGGMSYASLDHVRAGRPAPHWPAALFAPGRVPPDGHVVADLVQRRQLDSFASWSALRFVTWSLLPDGDLGRVPGVRTLTRAEVPGVLAALTAGRPVVLGLVVARGAVHAGDNHQVVAHAHDRDPAGRLRLHVLDPNHPGRDVTLVDTGAGWRGSDGRTWRGLFLHAYAARRPPELPSASRRPSAPVRSGDTVGLLHVWSGRALAGHGTAAVVVAHDVPTWRVESASDDGVVPDGVVPDGATTAGDTSADGAGADGGTAIGPTGSSVRTASGRPLRDGDLVRLVRPATAERLGLTPAGPALARTADDTWRVQVDGGGPWRAGSRVRLLHEASGRALRVDRARGPRLPVAASAATDDRTWWTVADHAA